MPEQSPSFEPSIRAGYELSTVHHRGVGYFILWFIVVGLFLQFCVWLILGRIIHHVKTLDPRPSVLQNESPLLDQPLQPAADHNSLPWQDMAALHERQYQQLHSYGLLPNDRAHIPIGRAMELLLHSGALKAPQNPANTQPYINTTQPAPTENRT